MVFKEFHKFLITLLLILDLLPAIKASEYEYMELRGVISMCKVYDSLLNCPRGLRLRRGDGLKPLGRVTRDLRREESNMGGGVKLG